MLLGMKPGHDGSVSWTLERIYTLFPMLKEARATRALPRFQAGSSRCW